MQKCKRRVPCKRGNTSEDHNHLSEITCNMQETIRQSQLQADAMAFFEKFHHSGSRQRRRQERQFGGADEREAAPATRVE